MDHFKMRERLSDREIVKASKQGSCSQLLFDALWRRAFKLFDFDECGERLSQSTGNALKGIDRWLVLAPLQIGDGGRRSVDSCGKLLLTEASRLPRTPHPVADRPLQSGSPHPKSRFGSEGEPERELSFLDLKLEASFATGCKHPKPSYRGWPI